MGRHALLSPSKATRWINCPPSARLEEGTEDIAGEAADEGSLAHKLSDLMLKYHLKHINKVTFLKETALVKKHKLYEPSMWEYCEQYKAFVLSQYNEALEHSSDAVIVIEQEVSLHHIAPESFGTRDIAIATENILFITDLKYGKGVEVNAEDNEQLMLYALGTLEEFEPMYNIHTVRLSIFQPRIDNFSSWELTVEQLKTWGELVAKPAGKLAFNGKGKRKAGPHCKWCKVSHTCKALADHNMELAVHEFAEPQELSDKDLVKIFKNALVFKNWINSIEVYMLKQAVEKEKQWPGLKLVEGKSNRYISDEQKAIAKLKAAKIRPDKYLSKPSLLGITALEKNIGAALITKSLKGLIIKPEGKPTLVDKDDPRNEWHSASAAVTAFGSKKQKTSKRLKR